MKLIGFQLADLNGKNIQGDDADPTSLASFEVMTPQVAAYVMENIGGKPNGAPKFLLMPIYEGCIERPRIVEGANWR